MACLGRLWTEEGGSLWAARLRSIRKIGAVNILTDNIGDPLLVQESGIRIRGCFIKDSVHSTYLVDST